MIEQLLPAEVVAVSSRADLGAELLPEEEAAIARAVERRRREFATVRALARDAYARLGVAAAPVVPGPHGEPSWAPGVVGSITHCDGYRACALARESEVLTVGIDAEPHAPLPDGLLADVASAEERTALAELAAARPEVHWDRLLFSAKEAAYKAWFPLLRRRLGFEDAVVRIDADRGFEADRGLDAPAAGPGGGASVIRGSFAVRLTGDASAAPDRLLGRWLARDGLVVTAIAVPANASR